MSFRELNSNRSLHTEDEAIFNSETPNTEENSSESEGSEDGNPAVKDLVYPEKENVDAVFVEIISEDEMANKANKKGKNTQPQVSNPVKLRPSKFNKTNLDELRRDYGRYFPSYFEIIIPTAEDRITTPPPNYRAFYTSHLDYGLRYPFSPLLLEVLETYHISLTQLVPNSIAFIIAFSVLMVAKGFKPSFRNFFHLFRINVSTNSNKGYYYFSQRPGFTILENAISSNSQEWKKRYFFVRPPTVEVVGDEGSESHPYEWGYDQNWRLGGRKVYGELIPDDIFPSDLIDDMKENKYMSANLIGEAFLRKAGLSTFNFPIPIDNHSLVICAATMVENCRYSVVGKTVISTSKKFSNKMPIEQRKSRKRRKMQSVDLDEAEDHSFEEAEHINLQPPPSDKLSSSNSFNGQGFPPMRLRNQFGVLGCKTWSERNINGLKAKRRRLLLDKKGEYFTHCESLNREASLVDMIENHVQGKRAPSYAQEDSLVSDANENVMDKSIRLLLSTVFVKDIQRTIEEVHLEQLARAAHAHEVTGSILVSALYNSALHAEQLKFLEEKNQIISTRNNELERKVRELERYRDHSEQHRQISNPNLETDNPYIVDTIMDASLYEERIHKLTRELENQQISYSTSISTLETANKALRSQLESKSDDALIDEAKHEVKAESNEHIIRDFLNSPVFTVILSNKIGGLLLSSFFKGVDQLIENGIIPNRRREYHNVMDIEKDRKLQEYSPDAFPDVEYDNHCLAHLVKEFDSPLPVPYPDLNPEDTVEVEEEQVSNQSEG